MAGPCPAIEDVLDLIRRLSEPGGDVLRDNLEADPDLLLDELNIHVPMDELPNPVQLPDQDALDDFAKEYKEKGAPPANGAFPFLFLVGGTE